jgi:hypothetical protein
MIPRLSLNIESKNDLRLRRGLKKSGREGLMKKTPCMPSQQRKKRAQD